MLDQARGEPAVVLGAAPTPSLHELAIRLETPQLMVEHAAHGVEEQSPRAASSATARRKRSSASGVDIIPLEAENRT